MRGETTGEGVANMFIGSERYDPSLKLCRAVSRVAKDLVGEDGEGSGDAGGDRVASMFMGRELDDPTLKLWCQAGLCCRFIGDTQSTHFCSGLSNMFPLRRATA